MKLGRNFFLSLTSEVLTPFDDVCFIHLLLFVFGQLVEQLVIVGCLFGVSITE